MSETKEQVKHTETPWNIFRNEDGIDHIGTGTRKVVAFPWNKFENDDEANVKDEANAEFIVRTVNCHEDLLQEARWMHAVLLQSEKHLMPDERDHLGEIALVIAKAEGR